MAFSGNWLGFFFLGFLALFIVTSEISYKTLRQNIITGLTRKQYFLGKIYTILIISLISTIYYVIVTTIIGYLHTTNMATTTLISDKLIIFRFFLASMGYMSFGLFIGFIVKKSSLATLLYMVYILFLEMIIKWQILYKISPTKWTNFLPMNVIEDLTPNPAYQYADFIAQKELTFDFVLSSNESTIAAIIYILLFLGATFYFFNKRDL